MLVTDDLTMRAVTGVPAELARLSLAAGCDLALYSAGAAAATEELLATSPEITPRAAARLTQAQELAARRCVSLDAARLADERERLLA